jgi:plastocyanin
MRPNFKKFLPVMLFVLVVLAGCAGRGKTVTASPMAGGGSMISIQASNYKFSPSQIRVEKPGLLAVEIRNVSGSQRNFTLKDPRGKVLKTVDIHPAGSVIINVELPDPGVYRFYCNKTFHATLGMKGRIVVGR